MTVDEAVKILQDHQEEGNGSYVLVVEVPAVEAPTFDVYRLRLDDHAHKVVVECWGPGRWM